MAQNRKTAFCIIILDFHFQPSKGWPSQAIKSLHSTLYCTGIHVRGTWSCIAEKSNVILQCAVLVNCDSCGLKDLC
jgi:hypothetical protein